MNAGHAKAVCNPLQVVNVTNVGHDIAPSFISTFISIMLCMMQNLFQMAIQRSMLPGLGGHHQWYPYSYQFGHLMRQAEFLVKDAAQLLGKKPVFLHAIASLHSCMQRMLSIILLHI